MNCFQSELDYIIMPFFLVIKPTLCYILISSALVICLAGSMVGIFEAFHLTVLEGRNVCFVRSTWTESFWLESKSSFLPKVVAQLPTALKADFSKETSLMLGAHLSRIWCSNRKCFLLSLLTSLSTFFTFCCTDNITSTKQPYCTVLAENLYILDHLTFQPY